MRCQRNWVTLVCRPGQSNDRHPDKVRTSLSPFPCPSTALLLRVACERPGRSRALLAGIAGRKWQRRGAGIPVYSSGSSSARFWLHAVDWLHAGSYALDLSGQVWCLVVGLLLVVVLLWVEPDAAASTSTCSSTNKVCGLGEFRSPALMQLSSLAGHGGEERRKGVGVLTVRACLGRGVSAVTTSCTTVVLCRPPIFGAKGRHPVAPWRRLLNLQQRRLFFDGAAMALCIFFISSGLVPGDEDGGCRRFPSLAGGEAVGLDCFSKKVFEVLCVYYQDEVVISIFLEVLIVTCTTARL